MIKLKILKLGDYLGYPGGPNTITKGPLKRERGRSDKEKEQYGRRQWKQRLE